MKTGSDDHGDRFLKSALREACDGEEPPDVVERVVGGGEDARRAAMGRARNASRRWSPVWLAAAIVVLGAAVVFGTSWLGGPGDENGEIAALDPSPDEIEPVQEPQRVIPEDTAEFLRLLDKVEAVTVHALQLKQQHPLHNTWDLRSAKNSGVAPNPEMEKSLLRELKASAERGVQTGPRWAATHADCRVVLHLGDDREVHLKLRDDIRLVSAIAAGDLDSPGTWSTVAEAYVSSCMLACHELGFVTSPIELKPPRAARIDPDLRSVRLGAGFSNEDLETLRHFRSLRHLDLTWSKVNQTGFRDWSPDLLQVLRSLESLTFRDPLISDAAVAYLVKSLPNLRALDLSQYVFLPALGMSQSEPEHFSALRGTGFAGVDPFRAFMTHGMLRELNLSGHDKLTAQGLAAICAIPGLRCLNLSFCERSPLTAENFAPLQRAIELRELYLARRTLSTIPPAFRTGDLLRYVDGLPNLESLSLAFSNVTDHGMANLRALPSLRRLDLSYCSEMGDGALTLVADRLRDLQEVDLRGCTHVTARGVSKLLAIDPMRKLQLSRSVFSDAEREILKATFGTRAIWYD